MIRQSAPDSLPLFGRDPRCRSDDRTRWIAEAVSGTAANVPSRSARTMDRTIMKSPSAATTTPATRNQRARAFSVVARTMAKSRYPMACAVPPQVKNGHRGVAYGVIPPANSFAGAGAYSATPNDQVSVTKRTV